jgi:hypothetical protein
MSGACPYARELAQKIVDEDRARREGAAATVPLARAPVTYGWNVYDGKELARRAVARGGLEKITEGDAAAARLSSR